MELIHAAIPIFFTCIGLEIAWCVWRKQSFYHYQDSVNNLACGSLQQIFEIFTKGLIMAGYAWLYEHGRGWDIPITAWWAWALALIGCDFAYYWFHRASHRINLIWVGHAPHHQSEEYNLTVALRQGMFERIFSWLFRMPLALLGFPPLMVLACTQIDDIYQFFVHTRLVKRLGVIDNWLNTPSNHRVHHGKNPLYIDKNYGGILIIWDRLFGTYEPETETPVYGTVTPLASWNPLWANVKILWQTWQMALTLPHWRHRLHIWLKPPGWVPGQTAVLIPPPDAYKYQVTLSRLPMALALVQFGVTLWSATVFLETGGLTPGGQITWAILLLAGFLGVGALIEQKKWRWGPQSLLVLALPCLGLGWLPAHLSLWSLFGSGGLSLVGGSLKHPATEG